MKCHNIGLLSRRFFIGNYWGEVANKHEKIITNKQLKNVDVWFLLS